ncbi:TAFII55 protein conserved domain-containing protein [Cladophialophora immunda]|nr:TAFII55 protein conserved domain-containing protein [Cladophialophora immunda]
MQAAAAGDRIATPPLSTQAPDGALAPNDELPITAKQAPKHGQSKAAVASKCAPVKPRIRLHSPAHRQQPQARSILKPHPSSGIRKSHPKPSPTKGRHKSVTVKLEPEVQHFLDDSPVACNSNEENEPTSPSCDSYSVAHDDSDEAEFEMSDAPLPPPDKAKRPSLKLKFPSKPAVSQAGGIQPAPVQTPAPQSAVRTPSIKLKLPGTTTPRTGPEEAQKPKRKKKDTDTAAATPGSSSKKRKRESRAGEEDDEGNRPAPAPPKPAAFRKLTFKKSSQPTPASAPKPSGTAHLAFKIKGKIPKRPLGVGYDSELESEYQNDKGETLVGREADPVIHEGFVLRMQPGEDCDYLRKVIEDGTAGQVLTRGAHVNLRMLDTLGRRGILQIKDHKYATSLVDLPCIVEGMKSWDKKGWIKSIDICQMLLVLGRCNNEEEARNYPLPEDVDPKTYQYAHGLTAPMKWVRKRRFARTKRARVDDIEAVERRVHALLEADKAALSSKYQLLDHDPRLDEQGYSTELEEDEDAEGEPEDYFDIPPGVHGSIVETPMLTETPVQEEVGQEDLDALERMFFDEDAAPATDTAAQARSTLHPPEVGDSSFAVTSTSASPSMTAAHTPVSAEAAEASSDEDEDEDGGDEDEDRDDAEKEGDENKRQVMERIEDMQNKIAEQRELLKQTTNAILKKKLARKIQDLEDDVAMMRKNAGLGGDDDED